jgi:hypothetical protein
MIDICKVLCLCIVSRLLIFNSIKTWIIVSNRLLSPSILGVLLPYMAKPGFFGAFLLGFMELEMQ